MTVRTPAERPVKVLRRVLEAQELRLGPQRVEPINDRIRRLEPEAAPAVLGTASFFRIVTDCLWSSTDDLIVVFSSESADKSAVEFVRKVAGRLPNCNSITCITPRPGDLDGGAKTGGIDAGISWLSPDAMFTKLFCLPTTFEAQLRDSAGIERPDEFLSAFQRRRATVHTSAGSAPEEDRVELATYLESWLGSHGRRSPVLLLGERGTGKSWQLLHFAQTAYALHKSNPWKYGPAFFVKLRELVNAVETSSGATPILSQYVFERHPDIQAAFGGAAMLGALLGIGHTVVCVDGFDEMDLLPTDARVRARLTTLLLLLSKRTRFILSSRAGHFSSLSTLLNLQAWSGVSVGRAFEVLELLPFNVERKLKYIRDAGAREPESVARLLGLQRDNSNDPLKRALSICAGHPGLLAHLKDKVSRGSTEPLELISEAILAILIEFNLRHVRTRDKYRIDDTMPGCDKWVDLSARRRVELLSDLAWYMAERGLDSVDLEHLPPRLRLTYGIEDDALRRDLRSQTVLELVDSAASGTRGDVGSAPFTEQGYSPPGRHGGVGGGICPVILHPKEPTSISLVRFTLRDEKGIDQGVGESSVAGAYFLSSYLADRMTAAGPFGDLPPEVRLKVLGRVKLGPMVGAMLRDMLIARGCNPLSLGRTAWRLLRSLASRGGFRVYVPWYRHLATNLAMIGGLTETQAKALDPWTEPAAAIVHPPTRLADYDMVLVPSPPPGKGPADPFLLGVHEITNRHYLRFIREPADDDADSTITGPDWSVGRMTIAGGGQRKSLSSNHLLSNEYHLFFWLPTKRQSSEDDGNGEGDRRKLCYLPPGGILDHPVTYVSWYAAAAFCDWLSVSVDDEKSGRYYRHELTGGLAAGRPNATERSKSERCGYRLPTRDEWRWAARGGHEDIDRPWEMFPYYLPRKLREAQADGRAKVVHNVDALKRYNAAQRVVRDVLLDTGKRASKVLYDELNDFGLSGLVGNVREWSDDHPCADEVGEDISSDQRLILGATGYLGEATFDFKYQTPLYPRNTNPDVGFRVARSLNTDEVKVLLRRECELSGLAETPVAGDHESEPDAKSAGWTNAELEET